MVWLGALILMLVLWLQVWLMHRQHAPDPKTISTRAAVKYLASKEFAALPEKEQRSYFDRMRANGGKGPPPFAEQKLTREEMAAVHKNTRKFMQQEMKERMTKFFTLSQEEKNQFLDNMIKEMQNRRKQDQAAGRTGGGPGGPDDGNRQAGMQGMLENTDSNTRAQMHEFMTQLHAREQQAAQQK